MNGPYRATRDASPEAQAIRLETLTVDIGEIKVAQQRTAEALEKLVRLEEQQRTTANGLDRAFSTIKAQEERIRQLELAQPRQALMTGWMERGIWAVVGGAGLAVAKKMGVM